MQLGTEVHTPHPNISLYETRSQVGARSRCATASGAQVTDRTVTM